MAVCICETQILRGGCTDVRVTELHYSRSHTCRKIFNRRNRLKHAEYVTNISLSRELRTYIFPRNYSQVRERCTVIKLNVREHRVNVKIVIIRFSVCVYVRKREKKKIAGKTSESTHGEVPRAAIYF